MRDDDRLSAPQQVTEHIPFGYDRVAQTGDVLVWRVRDRSSSSPNTQLASVVEAVSAYA